MCVAMDRLEVCAAAVPQVLPNGWKVYTQKHVAVDSATPWVGFDLDGTLSEYHGWSEAPGKPIMAMVELVKDYLRQGVTCKIVTARVSHADPLVNKGQEALIRWWCRKHIGRALEVTCKKDYNMLALFDDRAIAVRINAGDCVAFDNFRYPRRGVTVLEVAFPDELREKIKMLGDDLIAKFSDLSEALATVSADVTKLSERVDAALVNGDVPDGIMAQVAEVGSKVNAILPPS